jgi:hypothetical protein
MTAHRNGKEQLSPGELLFSSVTPILASLVVPAKDGGQPDRRGLAIVLLVVALIVGFWSVRRA